MSFGLTQLKKHKDSLKTSERCQHVSALILGNDLSAILKLVELSATLPPEELRLVTPRLLTRAGLIESHHAMLSTLRDNALTLKIQEKFPHAKTYNYQHESLFMKDGHWHRFNGRAKPMELMPGENYFLPARQELELSSLFAPSIWDKLDELLMRYQSVRVPEKLEKRTPTDLAQPDEWWLLCKDLGELTCTKLWLSLPARQVLKISEQGQNLPAELAAWYLGVKAQAGICLSWELKRELYPEARTLFVPQSMTHEWGHFILDVHPWCEEKKCYQVSALILLAGEEPTSEEMADKIKLCKRVLERVFPGFEENLQREFIYASENCLEWVSEQALLERLPLSASVNVLGPAALGPHHTSFLSRSLLAL